MTHDEWAACDDPYKMLGFLHAKVPIRKLRLLVSGYIRQINPLLSEPSISSLVDEADAVADGFEAREEFAEKVKHVAAAAPESREDSGWLVLSYLALSSAYHVAHLFVLDGDPAHCEKIRCVFGNPCPRLIGESYPRLRERYPRFSERYPRLKAAGLGLLKLFAGHPYFRDAPKPDQRDAPNPDERTQFRVVPFDDEWRTSTAVAIAAQMYESRDFSAMPILADSLQDAGCDNDEVLGHCRGPGPHVRGCWVVDLVLGKS